MSDQKFTVKPGGKVIIEIGGDKAPKKQKFVGHLSAKGLIKSRRENEYLPRRTKKKGGWRFFDLGQPLVESAATDVDFFAVANTVIDLPGKTVTTGEPNASEVEAKAAYYTDFLQTAIDQANAELDDPELFPDGPPANREPYIFRYVSNKLQESFYKLTKTATEQFDVTFQTPSIPQTPINAGGGDRWLKDDTIRIDPGDDISIVDIRGNPLFERIFLAEGVLRSQGDKVTQVPDPDADELLDFSLARTADFYLTPSFGLPNFGVQGQKTEHDRPDLFYYQDINGVRYPYSNPYQWTQDIYSNYLTFPRRRFLDYYAAFNLGNFAIVDPFELFEADEYEIVVRVGEYLLDQSGSVLLSTVTGQRRVETDNGVITENVSVLEVSNAAYPNTALFPPPPAVPVSNAYGNPLQIRGLWFTHETGRDLKAIIKQNNQFYYVWAR